MSIADDTLGGDWQAGACVDDWTLTPLADATTFPDGYASVRAWRLMVPFAAGWPLGDPNNQDEEDIVIDLEMLADPTAPPSDYEALPDPSLQIAWNNVSFRATNVATGRRLLAAEAIKTGVVMPAEYPLESTGLRIGNLVWQDANNDGIAQDGEQGMFDVTVELWNDLTGDGPSIDDTLYDTSQTDAEGHYLFDDADLLNRDGLGLPAGNYYVAIPSVQTGAFVYADSYSSTVNAPIANDDVDNDDNGAFDSDDLITPLPAGLSGTYSGTVNLALGTEPTDEQLSNDDVADDDDDFFDDNDSNVSVDFGFYQLRLGNHIWLDSNNDGDADSNEPAIENMQVQLFLDADPDGVGPLLPDGIFDPDVDTLLDTDTTDNQGQYLFEGLDIGNYFIAIPSGQTGLDAAGTAYATDLLASSTATSASGAALTADNDDDGAPGAFGSVTSVEYASASTLLTLTVGGAIIGESDSSQDGVTGSSSTDPADANAELTANIAANAAFPDTNSFLSADFGFVPAVSLGSTIWVDQDADGVQDPGEGAIIGATVTLLNASGAVINDATGNPITAVTDANGQYNFNQLPPGTYRVSVNLATSSVPNIDDFVASPVQQPAPSGNSNTDSNIDFSIDMAPADQVYFSGPIELKAGAEPTAETDPINAAANGVLTDPDQPNQTGLVDNSGNMTLDMGFVPPVSLGSTLWVDDGDGIQELGEAPIVGATVTLLNADGTQFDSNPFLAGTQTSIAVTDAQGQYNFDSLPPNTYRVSVDLTAATNTNATALIPTLAHVADPNANPLLAASNLDSNIDVDNAANNATTDVWVSEQITLSVAGEVTGETDPIGTPGADQPNQGLIAADDPDSSGNMTLDLGFIEPVSLGSTVWLDADLDGTQDDDELGVAGATVMLLDSTGTPVTFDADPSTPGTQNSVTTDATGQYNFDGLPIGSYFVEVTFPSGALSSYLPTPTQVAGANTNNSNSDSNIASTNNNGTATDTSDDRYRSELIVLTSGGEPTGETDVIDANATGGAVSDQPNQDTEADPDANGNMTVDFGFYAPVSLGSTVWLDTNANGTQDDAEVGIAGATVTLLNANGSAVTGVMPVTTDATGQYNFNGLLPGDYRVKVTLPTDRAYAPTPTQVADPDAAGDVNTDSNVDFGVPGTAVGTAAGDTAIDDTYTSGVVTLTPGGEPTGEVDPIDGNAAGGNVLDQPNQDTTVGGANPDNTGNMTVDFGFIEAVSLGSTLWVDDGDGIQEAGEAPIVGATVTLLSSAGTPVTFDTDLATAGVQNSVVTDANGQYNFDNLPAGTYSVSVDLTAATNTNATALIPTIVNVANADANPLLAATNLDSNVDADNVGNNATTDVWFSEQVTLSVGGEATGETDPIGAPASDQPNQGLSTTEDPDSSGNMALDLGFIEPVSLGSTVWLDADLDGTQDDNELGITGATVTLLDSIGTPVTFDVDPSTPGIQNSVTTDATGQYNFDGLPIGSYFVEVTFPSGALSSYLPTPTQVASANTNNSNSDSNIATTNNNGTATDTSDDRYRSELIVLTVGGEPTGETDAIDANATGGAVSDQPNQDTEADPDANGNMTVDFGFYAAVSLGSTVWLDANANGTQDDTEVGIVGATVTLLNTNGSVMTGVMPVMTDATGQYNFNGLLPGDYRVKVTLPTDRAYAPTPTQVADPDAAGDVNSDSNVDFGVPGTAVGTAAGDTAIDDTYTSGVVTLTPGGEPTGEVDPIDGNAAGGNVSDQPNQDTTVGGADPDNSGNMAVDFGFIEAVSLGSTLWVDDGDGIQEAGEVPIVGATVTLLSSAGTPVTFDTDLATGGVQNSVVTDANGQYSFDNLPAGTYSVSVDLTAATNTNATALIPTPVQVANADANPLVAATNLDSNVDADNAGNNATTDVWFSEQVTLSVGGEATSETDPIGAPGTDQPNQGLSTTEDPDSSGNMTLDLGFIEPVSLGSTVWLDADLDGTQDDDELGVTGATVMLLDSTGTPVTFDVDPSTPGIQNSVTTDATGQYNFDGLPIGSYFVEVTFPSGALSSYLPTPTQVAGANTNDSNNDSNIATTSDNGSSADTSDDRYRSELIVLTSGGEPTGETDVIDSNATGGAVFDQPNQDALADPDANGNMTVDFGFYAPVSLGSTVWEDLDGDGTQDSLEPGIQGATVTLLDSTGTPVSFDADPSTPGVQNSVVTDATGQYNFDGLLPGSYRVQVDLSTVVGGSDLFPGPLQVADPDAVVGVDDNTDSNIDFVADTNTSDQIHISGLIDLSPGAEPINETDVIGGGIDQPNQDMTVSGVDPDSSGNMTLDLGFVRPVSLGSTIWQDENADGTQNDGEPTILGATVTLLDFVGVVIDGDPYAAGIQPVTTMTDSEGQYFFNGLPPGDYRVQVDLSTVVGGGALIPSPVQIADPDLAGDNNTDSNIDLVFDPILVDQIHTSGVITLLAGSEPVSEVDPIDAIDGNGNVPDAPGQTAANPDSSGNMTVDMGFYAPVSVGSFIWEDTNGDGLQDASEPPLASAVVKLLAETASGSGVFGPTFEIGSAVAVSDISVGPDGLYEFTNLFPGNYKVQVTPPVGFFPSSVQNSADNDDTENDSNIASEPSAGVFESGVFEVTSGVEPNEAGPDTNRGDNQDGAAGGSEDLSGNMTIDFGFVPPASLGNYVWLDLDMDGVQDANEDGIANVTVNLYQDSDGNGVIDGTELTTPVATTVTGPNGGYLFSNLEPGVAFQTGVSVASLPAGLVQTFDEGDGVGATDSRSAPIVLEPSEFHETADFGYAPPAGFGAVGDTVWVDADDDGVQDQGEPGIAGVTVSITPPLDVDLGMGLGVPITTMTDGNGKYLFPNLPLNESYIVEVDTATLPLGYVSGPSNLGDPDVRDGNSTNTDNQTTVTLTAANPINLDLDFGYLPPADQDNSIGDTLWMDVDRDGNGPGTAGDGSDASEQVLPGVTVTLIQDNGDGIYNPADDTVFSTAMTNSDGMYVFTGIPDGDYIVLVTDQNNVLADLEQTVDADDLANAGSFAPVTPNASFVDDLGVGVATPVEVLDQDFGYVDSNTSGGDGTVGDTIFFDENNSGSPDDGEGLEGVMVSLFGPGPDGDISTAADNVLLSTQVTDENGNYLFTGLDISNTGSNPGTDYQVVVDITTLPNGGDGWSNTVDPDTIGSGDSVSVTTLTSAAPVDLDQDFGYLGEDGNSLSGTVWSDTDGDGEQGETGSFSGVTIEVRDQNGNVIRTVITDSNGHYEVTNLPDGIYTVVVTDESNVLNGFEHTDSPNGTSDVSDQTSKDDTGYIVDLDSAGTSSDPVNDTTGDFGYKPVITNPISLGSFIATAESSTSVLIKWTTQTEVANLGFYLYGQVDGEWQQLNEALILGFGDSVSIQRYEALVSTSASIFAIADIDVTGSETLHGPYLLGREYGGVVDRKVIDWSAEKTERERKGLQRDVMRKQQQQKQLNTRIQLAN